MTRLSVSDVHVTVDPVPAFCTAVHELQVVSDDGVQAAVWYVPGAQKEHSVATPLLMKYPSDGKVHTNTVTC